MTSYVPLRDFRKASGRMFKSVDYTYTYFQGCGAIESPEPACPVCWTKWSFVGPISRIPRLMQKDPTTLIPEAIKEAVIFMNSAHDTFAPVIPTEWIDAMIYWMGHQDPSIEFLLQSKWIDSALYFMHKLDWMQARLFMATTLETDDQSILNEFGFMTPSLTTRLNAISTFKAKGYRTRLSLEPLYRFDWRKMTKMVEKAGPELVEMGLDNYYARHKLKIPQPTREACHLLKENLEDLGIEVFLKASMKRFLENYGGRPPLIECQGCGWDEDPTKLQRHHIKRQNKFEKDEVRNFPENIKVLCPRCHMMEHHPKWNWSEIPMGRYNGL